MSTNVRPLNLKRERAWSEDLLSDCSTPRTASPELIRSPSLDLTLAPEPEVQILTQPARVSIDVDALDD
jgi:hypothetical protein